MGDSGALLLGFTLGAVSVQGLLKTAALATLVLPLLVLAVPLLDTSFVVAQRIKHGRPIYLADRTHLHHRFENIGFSQRRAVVYLYAWCVILALAALATRFVHPHRHGHWDASNVALDAASALLALGASVYVVYLLEIVKLANPFIRRREEQARTRRAEERLSRGAASASLRRRTGSRVAKSARMRATAPLALSRSRPARTLRYAAADGAGQRRVRSRLPRRAHCSSVVTFSASAPGTLIGWAAGSLEDRPHHRRRHRPAGRRRRRLRPLPRRTSPDAGRHRPTPRPAEPRAR